MQMFRRIAAAVTATGMALAGLAALTNGAAAADTGDLHRITFPVQEKVSYGDDWLAPRAGHLHQGNDLMGAKLFHELAAVDGVISYVKIDTGISGNMLTLKGDDGWFYYYIHINNDTPGTDDGLNPPEWRFAPGIAQGVRVKAGQFIAYMGDSGDAETTGPHLHFEVHRPDGLAVDPFPSLRLAQGASGDNHCSYGTNPETTTSNSAGGGYWLLGRDGGVFSYGNAAFYGSTGGMTLNSPVVGMAATPTGKGYWLVAADGGIFSYGDATFYGSTGSMHLNQPVVGMAATPSGKGYWLFAGDGGIFSYGDATFYGSTGSIHLNKPVVGMASTPTGKGYWLVASDGGIFNYGDAKFFGSTGAMTLARPIAGMATAKGGNGYWLLGADGGVFSFGTAPYLGALPSSGLCVVPQVVRSAASMTGNGYWMAAADGTVWAFGDSKWYGDLFRERMKPNAPIVGMAVSK